MPETTNVQLQQQTVFGLPDNFLYNDTYEIKQTQIAALLLRRDEANLTYPKNTFDDLVFPAFESIKSLDSSKNLSVTINTQALKVEPSCVEVPKDKYRLTFRNYTESGKTWFYSSFNEHTPCPGGQGIINLTTEFPLGEASLFGRSNDFDWFSVWRCNYTWAELDTEVNMIASDDGFIIDPENPPRPDLSSLRPLDPPIDLPQPNGFAGLVPEINQRDRQAIGVEYFFLPLVEPYGPLSKEAFGDPEKVEEILQLLHHNYAFSAAQIANTENRKRVEDVLGTTSGALLLNATVLDRGRRRLVQDPNVTYILVGILGAVILVNMWALMSTVLRRRGSESSLLDMDVAGLALDGWRSIASMAGLLSESNASTHLPPNTELLSTKELHGQMSDVSFRLGWFRREWDQTRHYTIGVMDDGEFNFMGVRKTVNREKTDSLSQERVEGWI
ncbi:uncharacterized protein ColSpa_09710 [Colletotrichum spaethianum]|uniref:Uncharacterized protein n=1 Tax=Colletotrichum spaethianum TaxID=700344 RepID=A0AA37UJE5_9PEZI|nr:uncharacterized protein ColSpa_09710 [Colletotrichum spaethianum]GKT49529.1 hypothetical protein ColSpa_09710 [Colletotrichum spaethianum]